MDITPEYVHDRIIKAALWDAGNSIRLDIDKFGSHRRVSVTLSLQELEEVFNILGGNDGTDND